MEKIYELNDYKLVVKFKEKLIQLKSPLTLQKYLATDIDNRSAILVQLIKNDYLIFMAKELAIKNNSLIIEIWAHVYASHFARGMKNLIRLQLVENIADFIIKRSDTIDCGERDLDHNRKLWDVLANFKRFILRILPNKMK